jgi:hypothetical protein
LCEASFVLAQVALAAGEKSKGLDLLEGCIQTGMTGFAEFTLARLELQRLAPEREERFRPIDETRPRHKGAPSAEPGGREKSGPESGSAGAALPS